MKEAAELSLEEAVAEASTGNGPQAPPARGWSTVTEVERQVATLVAEGLTNPQIAGRLLISRRTVKRRLAHIFEKLGVAGRTELAREVGCRGQEPFGSDRSIDR